MKLTIEILNKEIERREILLSVENNVLIQNDMFNEIEGIKSAVEKLNLASVDSQRELLHSEVFALANKLARNGMGDEAVKMHRIANTM